MSEEVWWMEKAAQHRRLPVGADPMPGGGAHFRVWAPRRKTVELVIEGGSTPVRLEPEGHGYHSGHVGRAGPGTLYRYRLDGEKTLPDPASRWQPEGPHGPSCVVDPAAFAWTDRDWRGLLIRGQVLYELHVGTFTPEGTWEAAAEQLPELAALGVTAVEVMPAAEFTGRFGWGYDGVDHYAPSRVYGTPDDMRRFVDRAHALGLGVLLDVVYNHLGPDGAYHREFSETYCKASEKTDWGQSLNFDSQGSGPVREFFVANAGYWIDEFHLDGLRLDATHAIHDESPDHLLAELTRHTRARAADSGRSIILIAENETQDTRIVRPPDRGGYGLDAIWSDDFHHAAIVAMTRRAEGYYTDYRGSPQEFVSAVKWGLLFQGQSHRNPKKRRGTPVFGVPSPAFVNCLENHDQVSNSASGDRLHRLTSPGLYKAMTSLMLLGPGTPMLFQGQEFAASSPFLYFADHAPELAEAVREGRKQYLAQFQSIAHPEIQQILDDPGDPGTFRRSKLDLSEREKNAGIYRLYRDLIRLRREDPVFSAQDGERILGATFGDEAFALRFFGEGDDCRLLIVNLGRDIVAESISEPLLAPPLGKRWEVLWYSEAPRYGGYWAPPLETDSGWRVPGHVAVALHPVPDVDTG
jgi:maltooligosyltrehalose trehalohydrolase